MIFETENIEFKVQFTDEIYKEVIAFANTEGGVVYVGIDQRHPGRNYAGCDHVYQIHSSGKPGGSDYRRRGQL